MADPSPILDPADVCRRYGSSVLRRCQAILRDAAEAEDAAQEVFVTVMTKGSQFRSEAAISTWLYRVTTNLCLNRLRSEQRRVRREQSERVVAWADVAPVDPYEHYTGKALLEQALRELDALSQAIFVYRYLDGMTLEEVAEATGKSRKTIGKRAKKIEAFVVRAESAS